jgi:hypothetical protein
VADDVDAIAVAGTGHDVFRPRGGLKGPRAAIGRPDRQERIGIWVL